MLFTSAHRKNRKRLSGWVLLCVAVAQLLLPLSTTAAMLSASEDSPYYCGNMSAPMMQQLRALDLPAELLEQVMPDVEAEHCDRCVAASTDPDAILPTAPEFNLPNAEAAVSHAVWSQRYASVKTAFQARAPPQ